MAFLEAKKLVKYYGKILALNNVSLSINKGTIYGLVGPNGAGKSTLLRIIVGVTKPTFGHVFLDGKEITFHTNVHLRKLIGYIPEKISLYNALTVREFLSFIAKLYDVPEDIFESDVKTLSELFGIAPYMEKYIGTLSKGYQQRVLVVSILMRDPPVYILDEPFYGLDPHGIHLLKKVLTEKVENGQALVLVASHILPLIQEFATRIGIIYKGRILLEKEGRLEMKKISTTFLERLYLESIKEVERLENMDTSEI